MARTRSLDDVNVAEEIVDRAMRLFNESGYDATSIRDLAEVAGISPSTLYHHYKNKQEILYFGLRRFMTNFNDTIIPVLRSTDRPATERILSAARLHIELSEQRAVELQNVRSFKNSLSEAQLRDVVEMQWKYQDAFKSAIRDGIAAGDFISSDLNLTTMAILDMLNGVRSWYRPEGPISMDGVIEHYSALVCKMLAESSLKPSPCEPTR